MKKLPFLPSLLVLVLPNALLMVGVVTGTLDVSPGSPAVWPMIGAIWAWMGAWCLFHGLLWDRLAESFRRVPFYGHRAVPLLAGAAGLIAGIVTLARHRP